MKRIQIIDNPREVWPKVDVACLDPVMRERFEQLCKAIEMYLEDRPLADIKDQTQVSASVIRRYLKKCLMPAPDGRIFGYRALIPNKRIKRYVRTAPCLEKPSEGQGGMAGLLQSTFKLFPDIEQNLIDIVLKRNAPGQSIHEKAIRPKNVHQRFIKMLKKAGADMDGWPFNTQHLGLRSIQKWTKDILDQFYDRAVRSRGEADSIAHLAVGTGDQAFISYEEPFECVQIDGYYINAFFSIEIENPEGGMTTLRLDRLWLLAMIEPISGAILAHDVVYRSQIDAQHIVALIRQAIAPANRRLLTVPGLEFPIDGGFPKDVLPACNGAVWGVMLLDGALAHLANTVHQDCRKDLGFILNWGPVAHFERRPDIERFFGTISTDLFMRLPSTTGSNPKRGRAKNAENNAITYRINAIEMEEVLSVAIANHNKTPSEGNFYSSPIEVINRHLEGKDGHFLLRHLPEKPQGAIVIPHRVKARVRGGRAQGRRPYVQFESAHYTNSILAHSSSLVGEKLILHFDADKDISYCQAYLETGESIGKLMAGGKWGRRPHSLRTRKIINRLFSKRVLSVSESQCAVQAYLDFLTVQKRAKRKKSQAISPSVATEVTRIAKESNLKPRLKKPLAGLQIQEKSLESLMNRKGPSLMGPMPDLNDLLKKPVK